MRYIIFMLFYLSFANSSVGQKYVFSPTGTMEHSKIYVDTVIASKLKLNGKILFNYLDSTYSDTLNIRQYFSKKYDLMLKDTFEYLFVANLTNKAINFKKLNDQLVAEEFGRYGNFGFRPLNFFFYPICGTGINYDDLVLTPAEILIIKSQAKCKISKGEIQPNCFLKLLTGTNGVLVSALYPKPIGNNNFYINTDFAKDFDYIRSRLAFKDK